LRFKLLSGYQISYKPGWDCHGLPIELSAIKSLKKSSLKKNSESKVVTYNKSNPVDVRKNANQYALSCIDIQLKSFKQMNLLADWSSIYRTIDPDYMCKELDLFYDLYEKKLIYRNFMPVYWSVSSQTALAEFELEYNQNHRSNALYVAFELVNYPDEIKQLLSKS
jgi:isoleucyl-tRNA synthetase